MAYFIESVVDRPVYFFSTVAIVMGSVTVHELFHALAARWEGDDTAEKAGRFTLNPVAHMGWASLLMLALVGIAWGATPVNRAKFRHTWGDALVSVAGPLANLLLMVGAAALALWLPAGTDPVVIQFFYLAALLNAFLFLLNMLPVPPLDGYGVLETFVPAVRPYSPALQGYGFLILLLLFFMLGLGAWLFGLAEWMVATVFAMLRSL